MPIEQLQFTFASLDFPGRSSLYPHEVAEKLGVSVDQIYKLADEGAFAAIDLSSSQKISTKRLLRIPVESYRDFIVTRMTGPLRTEFIRQLPEATRIALVLEVSTGLPEHARAHVIRELRSRPVA